MHLILFGFKGCGKSFWGKHLSRTLNLPFIDTDEEIAQLFWERKKEKKRVSEIYALLGEKGFRSFEQEVIFHIKKEPAAVIALGGGAVLDPVNVEYLQSIGQLIYLRTSFADLRIKEAPQFAKNKSLEEIYNSRLPIYESIPALVLCLKGKSEGKK